MPKDPVEDTRQIKPLQLRLIIRSTHSRTVKKTPVRSRGTENKKAIVDEGLAAGDIIAVAGVSFLADGMEVKLLEGNGK